MHWNYRIASRPTDPVPSYGIYEVYYDEDGDIEMYSKSPMAPYGDMPEELLCDMELMMRAFDQEILNLNMVDKMIEVKCTYTKQKGEKK